MGQRPCARPHPMLPWLMPMVLAVASTSAMAYDCTGVADWNAATAYSGNAIVKQTSTAYQAKWWTQNNPPATNSGQWECGRCWAPATAAAARTSRRRWR